MRLIRTGFIVGLVVGVLAAGSAVAQRAGQPKAAAKEKSSTAAEAKSTASIDAPTAEEVKLGAHWIHLAGERMLTR